MSLNKRKMFRWRPEEDLFLLKSVAAQRPTEQSQWELIVHECNAKFTGREKAVNLTKRACIDRYRLLVRNHQVDSNNELKQ